MQEEEEEGRTQEEEPLGLRALEVGLEEEMLDKQILEEEAGEQMFKTHLEVMADLELLSLGIRVIFLQHCQPLDLQYSLIQVDIKYINLQDLGV
jgi:hypothetical protein